MTESVSDILIARQREFDHAGRPIAASFGIHVLLVLGLAVLPAAWFRGKPPAPTMTISLGPGNAGPDRSGQTATGGRNVDKVVPPEKHEPIIPVTPPKSAVPDPAATVVKTPPKVSDKPPAPNPVPSPPKQATGAQLNKGSALVETGAKGNEIGLASGGGGNNTADFDSCCKEFFNQLRERVYDRWQSNQGVSGTTIVEFTVERDGTISESHVGTPSGNDVLDLVALSAVKSVHLNPIPDEYKGKRMTILLRFTYNR